MIPGNVGNYWRRRWGRLMNGYTDTEIITSPEMHWSSHIQVIQECQRVDFFFATCIEDVCVCVRVWVFHKTVDVCRDCQCLTLSLPLLHAAPVRLLNRVSSPLKTWATLVPPSKTLRGTTLPLFIHSALKTRSDPLTPPHLQPVQTVALLTAGFRSFLCFYSGQQPHCTLSLV